ncbi:MAG: hypothetical protein IJ733_04205 [Lachnospiraceae bacterium]|nr:hypothetical protein [Lachnospiraceae bacterium]
MEMKITNRTMELSEVKQQWFYDEKFDAWCLEDIIYTDKAKQPAFQRLSIYVPGAYMEEGGVFRPEGSNPEIAGLILQLKDSFPEEYEKYYEAYKRAEDDRELARREYLLNPFQFIGTEDDRSSTRHYRVCVGASDADTSFSVNLSLALKLMNAGKDAAYELFWEQPHCEADYPGELFEWIDHLCR